VSALPFIRGDLSRAAPPKPGPALARPIQPTRPRAL